MLTELSHRTCAARHEDWLVLILTPATFVPRSDKARTSALRTVFRGTFSIETDGGGGKAKRDSSCLFEGQVAGDLWHHKESYKCQDGIGVLEPRTLAAVDALASP